MVTLVKHEWHQVDSQFVYELDLDKLGEIYPEMKKKELKALMKQIEDGEIEIDEILTEASNNDVEIEWDGQYDDWWTVRKGGYDITYELGDEDSWHRTPEPDPPYLHCSKCKFKGAKHEADWKWEDKDGNHLDDPKLICPYCESDTVLTEFGKQKEAEQAEWSRQYDEDNSEEDSDSERNSDLEKQLEELKAEFEKLIASEEEDEDDDEGESESEVGVYEGELNAHGYREGNGKCTWPDGGYYEGNWSGNLINGKGKYVWSSGIYYEGNWVDGVKEGRGKIVWNSGDFYEGNWSEDHHNGLGKYVAADGSIYEGHWLNGVKHGQGKFIWPDGGYYAGNWVEGKIQGLGKMVWAAGQIYEGQWEQGLQHGKGKLISPDGDLFEGTWAKGKKHGKGVTTDKNGKQTQETWVKGELSNS